MRVTRTLRRELDAPSSAVSTTRVLVRWHVAHVSFRTEASWARSRVRVALAWRNERRHWPDVQRLFALSHVACEHVCNREHWNVNQGFAHD